MEHEATSPMLVSLWSHEVFVVFIEATCDDGSNHFPICSEVCCNLKALLMACHTRHMFLEKLRPSRRSRSPSNASGKIMTVSHTVNNNNLKKWMYFPSSFFIS